MGEIANLYAKIGADTSGLKKGLTDSKTQLTGFGGQLNNTVKNLTGFSLTSIGVAAVVREVGKAVADTVNETQAYNLSMIDMARKMGTSTEEASKLAQVADDVRLSTEQLSTAMNFAIRNGIQPSIDGIAKLADEYIALEDPVEKGQLLLKTFGRSGMEMGKLLEKGGDGVRSMSESIEDGLIVTEKAAAASKAYYKELDILNDEVTALKMNIGNGLIPVLVNSLQQWRFQGEAVEELGPPMTEAEIWTRRLAAAQLAAAYAAGYESAAIIDMAESLREANGDASQLVGSQEEIAEASGTATSNILDETFALADLTKQQIFNAASANLDGQAALDLAVAMGLVTEDAITARKVLGELDQMQDDGRLSAKEYADAVLNLSNQIDGLKSKSIDVIVNIITNGKMPGRGGSGNVTVMGGTVAGDGSGGGSNQGPSVFWGGGKASGASYVVPPGFDDTWPVAPGTYAKSGERVDIEPRGRPDDSSAELVAVLRNMPNMIAVAVRDQLSRLM